jgi:hypothetical protein
VNAVEKLLQLGSSADAKDEQRRSALDVAKLMHASDSSDTDSSTWNHIISLLSSQTGHGAMASPQRTPASASQTPPSPMVTPQASRGRAVNARTPQDDDASAVDIASAHPFLNDHSNLQDSSDMAQVGDTVTVRGMTGIVRYRGLTKFEPGEWVGIQLADPVGRNNGIVGGVQYFKCPPRFASIDYAPHSHRAQVRHLRSCQQRHCCARPSTNTLCTRPVIRHTSGH